MCSFSEDSCYFYSHCIESHFRCGPTGFTQAYAEARCEAIDSLRLSDNDCEGCIRSEALYDWAVHQEECLKQKLLYAVENDFKERRTDPPTCLEFERRGFKLMKECSKEQTEAVCSALASDLIGFQRDIEKIARHFRVSTYYTTQVERMLRDMVASCGQGAQVTEIAQSVLSDEGAHSPRIVFCAIIVDGYESVIDSSKAVELISQNLNLSIDQFEFSAIDDARRCVTDYAYPQDLSPTADDELLFVTWHPEPDEPLLHEIGTGKHLAHLILEDTSGFATVPFYQYLPLRSSDSTPECGDGRRQAGELCDTGVRNTDDDSYYSEDVPSCSLSCLPSTPLVECSTTQLQTSECWFVSCGDGARSVIEECDDGNTDSHDGCSQSCRQEPDYTCTSTYNRTSVCQHSSSTPTSNPYPPATTSTPSTLHTSSTSLTQQHSTPSSSSSSSPSSSSSTSDVTFSSNESAQVATQEKLTSSSTARLHPSLRNLTLQCLVSILLSWTFVHMLMAR